MPYSIVKNHPSCPSSKPYAVVKKSDGKKVGCHVSAEKAGAQIGAIEASEDKEEDEEKCGYGVPLYGAISFGELEEMQKAENAAYEIQKLSDYFLMIAGNIARDTEINTVSAMNSLVNEYTKRMEDALNARQGKDISILDALTKPIPETDPEFEGETFDEFLPDFSKDNSFYTWKDAAGQWRWISYYSNKFRDSDNPPEIISEKSHLNFVEKVDSGEWPMPELLHWHIPGTRWGVAEWVAYSDGFALAAGVVDEGHEKEAELLSEEEDTLVSHGMPARNIMRDKEDSSIMIQHRTSEISPLPGWAAANKWTGFLVLNEGDDNMSLGRKKDYLLKLGFSEDKVAGLEEGLGKSAEALVEADVEFKEEAAEESVEETELTEEVEVVDEEVKEEEVEESAPGFLENEEFVDAMAELLSPLVAAMQDVGARISTVEAEVKELKVSDEMKVAELAEETPGRSLASLSTLIKQTLVGQEEAKLDGRLTLAKDGPTEIEDEVPRVTPSVTLNKIMSKQR